MNTRSSLLSALRKYRPRDKSDPLENFITEAFAWLLQNHEGFGKFFLGKIVADLKTTFDPKDEVLEWKTQVNLGGVFPDMVCEAGETVFIFEHKAWAHLHENQLSNYRDSAVITYQNALRHLILIVGGTHQFDQDPDLAICWRDVHKWIVEWRDHTDCEPDYMFADFCSLLESEGMGPAAPLSHASILSYHVTRSFESDLSALLKRVHKRNWTPSFPGGTPNLPKSNGKVDGDVGHGRFGLYFFSANDSEWKPGIFAGFLLDPSDHRVNWINPQSPDCTIIISVNPFLFPTYDTLESYRKMRDALGEIVKNDTTEFKFLDHLSDHEDPNRWHPIHIRRPMIDVFRGTKDAAEQDERFFNETSKILKLIHSCPQFKTFCNDLQNFTLHSSL